MMTALAKVGNLDRVRQFVESKDAQDDRPYFLRSVLF